MCRIIAILPFEKQAMRKILDEGHWAEYAGSLYGNSTLNIYCFPFCDWITIGYPLHLAVHEGSVFWQATRNLQTLYTGRCMVSYKNCEFIQIRSFCLMARSKGRSSDALIIGHYFTSIPSKGQLKPRRISRHLHSEL